MAPSMVLFGVDVLAHLGHVEGVVPVDHVSADVVSFLVVGAEARVAIALDVVRVS